MNQYLLAVVIAALILPGAAPLSPSPAAPPVPTEAHGPATSTAGVERASYPLFLPPVDRLPTRTLATLEAASLHESAAAGTPGLAADREPVAHIVAPEVAPNSSAVTWFNQTIAGEGNVVEALNLLPNLAWDPVDGAMVRAGGVSNGGPSFPFVTWWYRNGLWENVTGPVAPPPLGETAMAWDYADGYMVLFGGAQFGTSNLTAFSDTWIFHNDAWTELNLATAPPARFGASMAWDAADGELILFGGTNGTVAFDDTWAFRGGSWSQLSPAVAPPGRYGAGLAFDPTTASLILFGGFSLTMHPQFLLNDTWNFAGGVWSLLHPLYSPPARGYPLLANDTDHGVLDLTGGVNATGIPFVDNWNFSYGNWNSISWVTAPVTYYGAMADDPTIGAVLLWTSNLSYLGAGLQTDFGGQTWTFNGSGWAEINRIFLPAANGGPGYVYDSSLGAMVLFGGFNATQVINQTWVWRTGLWQELFPAVAPGPRVGGALVDDPSLGGVVLFGGTNGTAIYNDTWLLRNGSWSLLAESQAPSPRVSSAAAYDPLLGDLILFGGNDHTVDFNDTWALTGNGSWVTISNAGGPPPRTDAAATFDGALREPIFFGGTNQTIGGPAASIYNDTWAFTDGSPRTFGPATPTGLWKPLTTLGAPAPRESPGMAFDAATNSDVLTGGINATVIFGDTWELRNLTWSPVAPATLPPAVVGPGFAYDAGAGVVREFGGTGLASNPPTPIIVGYSYAFDGLRLSVTSSSPGGGLPARITFTGTDEGGAIPILLNWSFGDGSHAARLLPTPGGVNLQNETYYQPGTYNVTLTATDALGLAATVGLTETFSGSSVAPLTSVASASPSSGVAPLTVQFTGTPHGGAGLYTGSWTFGDGGTAAGLNASHVYTAVGTWTATFTATDLVGTTASSSVAVTVSPATGPSPLSVVETATPLNGTFPLLVQFHAALTGGAAPYTFTWTFGDGSSSTDPSPSHNYTQPGDYPANVTVRDSTGAHASSEIVVRVTGPVACSCGEQPAPGNSLTNFAGGWGPYLLIGVILVVAAVGVAVVLSRRNAGPPRTPGEPTHPEGEGEPAAADPPDESPRTAP